MSRLSEEAAAEFHKLRENLREQGKYIERLEGELDKKELEIRRLNLRVRLLEGTITDLTGYTYEELEKK